MAKVGELQSSRLPQSEPGQWDQSAALREAARIYMPEPIVEAVQEVVGEGFFAWLEQWRGPSNGQSYGEVYLRAARADLQYVARFLAQVARETLVECESAAAQEELAWFADGLAVRVEELADQVVAQLRRVRPAVAASAEAVGV
jgi:hypothetical protein